MANLKNISVNDQQFFRIPNGSTTGRPSSPDIGSIRLNTDFSLNEVYDGQDWRDPGTGQKITDIGKYKNFPAKSARQLQNVVGNTKGWYYIDIWRDGSPYLLYVNNIFDGGGYYLVLQQVGGLGGMPNVRYQEAVGADQIYKNANSDTRGPGSSLNSFNLWTGMKLWDRLTGPESLSGGRVVQVAAGQAVDLEDTSNHSKRQIWEYNSFSSTYGFRSPVNISNTSNLSGLFDYHAQAGNGVSTFDNESENEADCSQQYDNQPWWYVRCWSGNYWGYDTSDLGRWDGSGSDQHQYLTLYVREK